MKRIKYLLMLITLIGCYGRNPKIKTGHEGQPIPSFNILLADNLTYFNTATIPSGKPIVLFLFVPWCPYCKAQTQEIINNISSLKNISFYMITPASFKDFKDFYDHYKLIKYPNIIAGSDTIGYFLRYFGTDSAPYLAIYGKNKKLKQVLIGKSDVESIKKLAFN